jgi:hypothetical protein
MRHRFPAACAVLILVVCCVGCAARPQAQGQNVQDLVTDYDTAWKAVCKVMSRHFLISSADEDEGVVRAVAVRNAGKTANARTDIVAKVFKAEHGRWEVEVRATQYIETSEPHNLSDRTPRYQWQKAGFDKALENKLLREIERERFGEARAAHKNRFLD